MRDDKEKQDTGVIEALLDRLNRFRLPRLLELEERVDRGESIDESDLAFLQRVIDDGQSARGLFDRHPELQPLVARLTALHHKIVTRALENEKNKSGK